MGAQPNCWQGRAMMYLFEGLFIFYLGWLAWRILKANLARNILAVVAIIVAVLSSTLLFLLLAAILPLLFDNLVLVLGLNAVLSIGSYFVSMRLLNRRIQRDEAELVERLDARLRLPGWLDRSLSTATLLLVYGLIFVLSDLLVNLAGISAGQEGLKQHSFLFKHMLSPIGEQGPTDPEQATPTISEQELADFGELPPDLDGPESVDEAIENQSRLFRNLEGALRKSRDYIAEKTGTKEAIRRFKAVRELIHLSDSEKHWVISTSPELMQLLNHPSMVAIMDNDRVLGLIEEVAEGSISAVYKLGEEPAIKNLMDDDHITRVIRNIDLMEIRGRVEEYRRRRKRVIPAEWLTSTAESTTQIDDRLKSKHGWRKQVASEGSLIWLPQTKIGLAGTLLESKTGRVVQMECRTEGKTTVLLNGFPVEVLEDDKKARADLALPKGISHLILLIDFRGTDPPKGCLVEVYVP